MIIHYSLHQALLPLGGDSLVYGSADAGKTVRAQNPEFNEAMKKAAITLNLRSHVVGRAGNTVELHSAVDIGLYEDLLLYITLHRGSYWIR